MLAGNASWPAINNLTCSLLGCLDVRRHRVGSSSESAESAFLLHIVLPGEVLDDLGAVIDLTSHTVDGVGWLGLRCKLSLLDSVLALVLQGQGEHSLDAIL